MKRLHPTAALVLGVSAAVLAGSGVTVAQPKQKDHGVTLVHRIPLPAGERRGADVAPDGSRFGVGLGTGEVQVWDGKTGKEAYRLAGDYGPLFTADGKFVATYSGPKLNVYDAATGKRHGEADLGANIWGFVRLPGAGRIVVWTEDPKAHVYACGPGKTLHSWPFYPDAFFAWTPDGNVLLLKHKQGEPYHAYDVRNGKAAEGFDKILGYNRVWPLYADGEQAAVSEGAHNYLVKVKTGERVKELEDAIPGVGKTIAGDNWGRTDQRYAVGGNAKGRLLHIDNLDRKVIGAYTVPEGEKFLPIGMGVSSNGRFAVGLTDHAAYLVRLDEPKK